MKYPNADHRKAFTLVEILVVLAIIGILIGLLLPAIQSIREAAARISSMNNLKQIMLATINYSTAKQDHYPSVYGFDSHDVNNYMSFFTAILPYIEQGSHYEAYKKIYPGEGSGGAGFRVKIYVSPLDRYAGNQPDRGLCSYVANAVLFDYYSHIQRVTDGNSNTIAIAERYSFDCNKSETLWILTVLLLLKSDKPDQNGMLTSRPATFAFKRNDEVYPVFDPVQQTTKPSVPGLTFQVRPSALDCNFRIPQTPHSSGMLVALSDGSVRSIAPTISESTFWSAVTPNGGEVLGNDW